MGDMDAETSALIASLLAQDQQQLLSTEYNPYLAKEDLSDDESDGGGADGDFVPDEFVKKKKKGKRKASSTSGYYFFYQCIRVFLSIGIFVDSIQMLIECFFR